MEHLNKLRQELSDEWKKPKSDRDYSKIKELQKKISQTKNIYKLNKK